MDISVIIPALNEEKNIFLLFQQISPVLKSLKRRYEIIFIDDGSRDKTYSEMLRTKKEDKNVKIIKFKKNFGQTAAWDAGFKLASGDIVIVMDSDLQNDPKDIPLLLNKINEGYDVVSGWRKNRMDTLSKRFFSKISNKLRRWLTGERIHDSGCALKAYRRGCVKNLRLFGQTHRFITAILSWKGYKVGEVVVNHHPRRFEKTKYSSGRIFRGMMDLLVVVFWQRFSTRPLYIFGFIGLLMGGTGVAAGLLAAYLKFFRLIDLSRTFLPNAAVLFTLIGVNLFVSGLIADICIKNYYKDEDTYLVESIAD